MIQVTFNYDEAMRKWEAVVTGVENAIEARQSFSAVVLTCQMLNPNLLHYTRVIVDGNTFKIEPAV